MQQLTDAYNYALEDDEVFEKTLLGGGLGFIGFLIIPLIFYNGYFVKILKETSADTPPTTIPDWTNGKQLLTYGLYATAFAILSLLFLGTLTGLYFLPLLSQSHTQQLFYITLPTITALILLYLYSIPAIFTLYIREGISQATNIYRLKQILITKKYAINLTLITLLQIAFMIFAIFFTLITLGIGQYALPFITFPLNCAITYILGVTITQIEQSKDSTNRV